MTAGIIQFFTAIGEVVFLTKASIRELFRRPFEWRLIITQLELGGIDSWSITVLAAGFTGMVLSLQFAIGLEPFGASMYTGKLVSLGIVRELGPVLTALLVGGRVGAGYTAEIGSMNVTEQVDAIKALGADPVRKLVMPRVVAMVIASLTHHACRLGGLFRWNHHHRVGGWRHHPICVRTNGRNALDCGPTAWPIKKRFLWIPHRHHRLLEWAPYIWWN